MLGLAAHLKRLPDVDASILRWSLNQCLEPYRSQFEPGARRGETAGEARVRVMQTNEGEVYIAIQPLKPLPREVYEKGVCVETTEIERDRPRLKTTAFIGQSDGERRNIAEKGVFEALLVKNGRILEGMTSNFFYVIPRTPESASGLRERSEAQSKGGILYTARRDVLLGVTRRTVIRVARERGVVMKYRPLRLDQISAVSEAFITSSSRGIVPVVQIDDVMVGEGRVGELTRQLSAAYEAYVLRRAEGI